MVWHEKTLFCAGCGAEISVGAVMFQGRTYCCKDCMDGHPCDCAERMEWDEDRSGQGVPPSMVPA